MPIAPPDVLRWALYQYTMLQDHHRMTSTLERYCLHGDKRVLVYELSLFMPREHVHAAVSLACQMQRAQ